MADKCENAEKENIPPKKRHLSLSLNKDRRFGNALEENLQSMATFTMPKNSAHSSKWPTTNLHGWFADYNQQNPEQKCPGEVLLPSCSKELLNKLLCVYVVETRSKDSNPYPPKTVYALLCGILREMRVANPEYPNFLNKDDPGFVPFMSHRTICSNHYVATALVPLLPMLKGSREKRRMLCGTWEF